MVLKSTLNAFLISDIANSMNNICGMEIDEIYYLFKISKSHSHHSRSKWYVEGYGMSKWVGMTVFFVCLLVFYCGLVWINHYCRSRKDMASAFVSNNKEVLLRTYRIYFSILAINWLYVIGVCFYASLHIITCLFKCCIVYSHIWCQSVVY